MLRSDAVHGENLCRCLPLIAGNEIKRIGPTECSPLSLGLGCPFLGSSPGTCSTAGTMIGVSETLHFTLVREVLIQILFFTALLAFCFCLRAEHCRCRNMNSTPHHYHAEQYDQFRTNFRKQPFAVQPSRRPCHVSTSISCEIRFL